MSQIDQRLIALSDPTRRAILERLAQGEATVMEIAAPFAMTQPAITHHLKVLERAGLIARRRDGTRLPCRLVPGALEPVIDHLAALRRVLETSYARLDALLAEDDQTPGKDRE